MRTGVEIDLNGRRWNGVYVLSLGDAVVYVGQSGDVFRRVAQHYQNNIIDFDRAHWFEVSTEDQNAYEGALIRRLNPPECIGCPPDEGRDEEVLAKIGLEPDPDARAAFYARNKAHWKECGQRAIKRIAKSKLEEEAA